MGTSDCITTCDSTDLSELVEGFNHLELGNHDLDEMMFHNAEKLFAIAEEVRKKGRFENNTPRMCGLGDLNKDTLENTIGFF